MLDQIYYSVRNRLNMRLAAFGIMIIGNIFFYFLVRSQNNPMAWQTVIAIIFAALSFMGIFIVNLVATGYSLGLVITEPDNYLTMLTPVPVWKKLLGWVISSVFIDILGIILGIFFIVIISTSGYATMTVGGANSEMGTVFDWGFVYMIFILSAGYTFLVNFGLLWETVSKTLLRNIPASKLIGGIVALLVAFILSWTNIILLPFGAVNRFGPFFNIALYYSSVWLLALIVLLVFAQAAVMFAISVRLIDRR